MIKFSEFGYFFGKEHTTVSLLRGEKRECVELNNTLSRTVPNLFATDADGNYLVWTLVKEVEKQLSSSRPAPSTAITASRPNDEVATDAEPGTTPNRGAVPPPAMPLANNRPTGMPSEMPPVLEALDGAAPIFWCNTNREAGAGGNSLEQRMRVQRYAAAWTWGDSTPQAGTFHYKDHMQRVRCGHLILMYANGLGVIGIGRAREGQLEILNQHQPGRMRDYATEGRNAEEWRIPVEWLIWDQADPCLVEPLRPSFQEVTGLTERIQAVWRHFSGRSA